MNQDVRLQMMALLPRLRRFGYSLAGRWDLADDLVQETYARAIASIDSWVPGSRLDAWMFRILRNCFLNEKRALSYSDDKTVALKAVSHGSLDGVRAAEAQITFARVRQALALLPEDQRTALLLISVEGLSYKQVAEFLDVPLGTIASRVGRAREALKPLTQYDDGTEAGKSAPATAKEAKS